MKVGISVRFSPSIFSNGQGQAAIALGEIFEKCGWEVLWIRCGEESRWWQDAVGLCHSEIVDINSVAASCELDLFIDIDGLCWDRQRIAKKSVVFLRGNRLFEEIDAFPYIDLQKPTCLYNISDQDEVWIWDTINRPEDLDILQRTLKARSVSLVPFYWTDAIVRLAENSNPVNLQNNECPLGVGQIQLCEGRKKQINICCSQKNSSCAVFPAVALNSYGFGIDEQNIRICNADRLKSSEFFNSNILKNLSYNPEICGRERYTDYGTDTIVITHERFTPLRCGLFDIAWKGEAGLVHNCEILRDMGMECGYYDDCSVRGLIDAVKRFQAGEKDCVNNFRKSLSNLQAKSLEKWQTFVGKSDMKEVIVSFSDMWEGFDGTDNWFIDLLNYISRKTNKSLLVRGINGWAKNAVLHIFGPFGSDWKNITGCSRVFFSGEQWLPGGEEEIADLLLTHWQDENEQHLRLPIWMLYLNLFVCGDNTDGSRSGGCNNRNPNGVPLENACLEGSMDTWLQRPKFCAWVVSNSGCPVRNIAFQNLNKYRQVCSGGAFWNNIGGPIPCSYGGGGAGDRAKIAWMKERKYSLCYENGQVGSGATGYVTEKLLHAKIAGCVPIYWGDMMACDDFDPESFIQLQGKDAVFPGEKVEWLEKYPHGREQLEKVIKRPALGKEQCRKMWAQIDKIGKRMFDLIDQRLCVRNEEKLALSTVEPMLNSKLPAPVFVSFFTKKYAESAARLLESLQIQRNSAQEFTNMRCILYIGWDCERRMEADILKAYPWVELRRLPEEAQSGEGFWDIGLFGWKLWILDTVVKEPDLSGKLIVWTDAGVQWLRFDVALFRAAWERGILFFEDKELNRHWCSEDMVKNMKITDEELDGRQIFGGLLVFRGGHTDALNFFSSALLTGRDLKNLRGRRLTAILDNGQNCGHRHDQSIMSILRLRNGRGKFAIIDGEEVICVESLRRTKLLGKSIYHHRGDWKMNLHVLPNITDIWMIGLERRQDRWNAFVKAHPEFSKYVHRFPAIDGSNLELCQDLFTLFEQCDFNWKKSVMGCALSHIVLWMQLACEPGDDNVRYLILEDDVRFKLGDEKSELDKLETILKACPADMELGYLGGVLPGNIEAYMSGQVVEPINDIWGVIRPNMLFSRGQPRAAFHFCTYSYILSKSGAKKLIGRLQQATGCFTSIDHFLGSPEFGLKKYVMRELFAGCMQENDPAYIHSEFDNMGRVDRFDSDIWNNAEVFGTRELSQWRSGGSTSTSLFFLTNAIGGLQNFPKETQSLLSARSWLAMASTIGSNEEVKYIMSRLKGDQCASSLPKEQTKKIYYLNDMEDKNTGRIESAWLSQILPSFDLIPWTGGEIQDGTEDPLWLIVGRPHVTFWNRICKKLQEVGRKFIIIHLSDEGLTDDCSFYKYSCCVCVIRNYITDKVSDDKVITIPLGFSRAVHNKAEVGNKWNERVIDWSFHGTDWCGRREKIQALINSVRQLSRDVHWTEDWLSPNMSSHINYSKILVNSKFVACPAGHNWDTFRFWEALEHGAIPLYVRDAGNKDIVFWKWLKEHLSLIELSDWNKAAEFIELMKRRPEDGERYRVGLLEQWHNWKKELKDKFRLMNN
jgi:GR25 family glycosyltransferase involved in LPS biosynthesis